MSHRAAAEYLVLSTQHLYALGDAGVGPPRRKLGQRWYYRRSDLDAWVESEPDTSAVGDLRRRRRRDGDA